MNDQPETKEGVLVRLAALDALIDETEALLSKYRVRRNRRRRYLKELEATYAQEH